jgi:hypothetical protein
MENTHLRIYDKVKTPPEEALRPINAGRLKGKTDISPQWRIKVMTETFGVCGIGWKFEISKQWTEPADSGQIFAFVNVDLYVKDNDKWSEPIPGTGGTLLIVNEKNGTYSNDEAFKMSLTDALGMAMKCLGVASDVYMGLLDGGGNNDSSKYQNDRQTNQTNFVTREIKPSELEKFWNGKIYKGNIIYIEKDKIQLSQEQHRKLLNHSKYKPDEKK